MLNPQERKELIRLINEVPATEFGTVKSFLEAITARSEKAEEQDVFETLKTAALLKEPLTEEEERTIREAERALSDDRPIRWENIKKEIGI